MTCGSQLFQGWEEPRPKELTFLRQTRAGCCSVAKSCLILRPHGLQHARLPCPSQGVLFDKVKWSGLWTGCSGHKGKCECRVCRLGLVFLFVASWVELVPWLTPCWDGQGCSVSLPSPESSQSSLLVCGALTSPEVWIRPKSHIWEASGQRTCPGPLPKMCPSKNCDTCWKCRGGAQRMVTKFKSWSFRNYVLLWCLQMGQQYLPESGIKI